MQLITQFLMALCLMVSLAGCDIEASSRDKNMKAQETLMDRATAAVPVPHINNFLAREAVAKQVRRLDEKGKLFYVYILGQNGQQVGYYVANTRPVSTCALLTPSEELVYSGNSTHTPMGSPSLGGVYGFGGGCNSHFFFDAATDAYVEISGLPFFVADQPLAVDADPIKVAGK